MNAISSIEAFEALKQIFDLPEEVVELTIYLKVNDVARMELLCNIIKNNNLTGEKELKKYKLVESDEH